MVLLNMNSILPGEEQDLFSYNFSREFSALEQDTLGNLLRDNPTGQLGTESPSFEIFLQSLQNDTNGKEFNALNQPSILLPAPTMLPSLPAGNFLDDSGRGNYTREELQQLGAHSVSLSLEQERQRRHIYTQTEVDLLTKPITYFGKEKEQKKLVIPQSHDKPEIIKAALTFLRENPPHNRHSTKLPMACLEALCQTRKDCKESQTIHSLGFLKEDDLMRHLDTRCPQPLNEFSYPECQKKTFPLFSSMASLTYYPQARTTRRNTTFKKGVLQERVVFFCACSRREWGLKTLPSDRKKFV